MARYRLELGPIPLHHQVYLDLKAALDAGEWAAGDRLPTERDLAARYGCSLITVRRALSELVREGRLERTRGRGTFVLPPRIDATSPGALSFTEEMQTRGLDPADAADRGPARGGRRGRGGGARARARLADPLPRAAAPGRRRAAPARAGPPAGRAVPGPAGLDLEHGSLYDLLTERYGAGSPGRARPSSRSCCAPARRACSGQPPRTPALLIEGIASTADGTPVEFGRTYVRGDRTRYYVERVVDPAALDATRRRRPGGGAHR